MGGVLDRWNYLELEGLILARLEETGHNHPPIFYLSAADLDGILEKAQPAPAFHVLFWGDLFPQGDGSQVSSRAVYKVIQRWLVLVAVRNVSNQITGQAARTEAGPLLTMAHVALAGWTPVSTDTKRTWKPLRRVTPGVASLYREGFAYFATMWEAETALQPI
jgi:hypothetical protein